MAKLTKWFDEGGLAKAGDLALKAVAVVAALIALNLFSRSPALTETETCTDYVDQQVVSNAYGGKLPPPIVNQTIEQEDEDNGRSFTPTPGVGTSTTRLVCGDVLNVHAGLPKATSQRAAKVRFLEVAYPESYTSAGEGNMVVPHDVLLIGQSPISLKQFEQAVMAIESARTISYRVAVVNNGPGFASGITLDHPTDFRPSSAITTFGLAQGASQTVDFVTDPGHTQDRVVDTAFPPSFQSSQSIDTGFWEKVVYAALGVVLIVTVVTIARYPTSANPDLETRLREILRELGPGGS